MSEIPRDDDLNEALFKGSRHSYIRRAAEVSLEEGEDWRDIYKSPENLDTFVLQQLGVMNPDTVDQMVEMAKADLIEEWAQKILSEENKKSMIRSASLDPRLERLQRYLIWGLGDFSDENWFEIMQEVANDYGLTEDELELAVNMSEDRQIEQGLKQAPENNRQAEETDGEA